LEAAQWDLPIALEEDLKHVMSCHAQTKLIEDAVGAQGLQRNRCEIMREISWFRRFVICLRTWLLSLFGMGLA
jgi:hypothetical protein